MLLNIKLLPERVLHNTAISDVMRPHSLVFISCATNQYEDNRLLFSRTFRYRLLQIMSAKASKVFKSFKSWYGCIRPGTANSLPTVHQRNSYFL